MKLHTNQQLFQQAIDKTAQELRIPPIYVEKDYWVTYVLYHLFHDEQLKQFTIFKGGTALSKCYEIIKRFSEDIDLVIEHDDTLTNNQLDKRIKQISQKVSNLLTEVELDGVTNKRGMIRKTAHEYPRNTKLKGNFGQVRDKIIVEASRLGHFEPYTEKSIVSLLGKMILATEQKTIAEQYDLLPFTVRVLEAKRTFCEKIMSLVRFSYTDNHITELKKKIRHCYDLHQLLELDEIKNFFNSPDFATLLNTVREDDKSSFKSNSDWLDNPLHQAKIFCELNNTWLELQSTYEQEFSHLVYGDLPPKQDVLASLNLIKNKIDTLSL